MFTGENIKELRVKLGIQQTELAEKLNTTVHTIRYWEQNPNVSIKSKYEPILKLLLEENVYDENMVLVNDGFFKKIKENLARIPFLRDAIALYFCAVAPETPIKMKAIAFAALAYFIMPIDAIPDAIPIAGFTDDAAMIIGAIATLESIMTDEYRIKAEEWLNKLT
ncbi:MAG: hypothetical protein CMG69_01255 [Candidatus Marinimicrobia bacterium]|nr:hypothetical protein [Candidatus Neomarinimicrobiota bacterium]|tara:strand:- start:7 stop:504 length:498 start_codon:yes stop_codon:yes gene_type:complete